MATLPAPVLQMINEMKPPKQWTSTDAQNFKQIYLARNGKMIDSLNESYPFSAFFDRGNYTINAQTIQMNELNKYTKGSPEYAALLKQWNDMTTAKRKEWMEDPRPLVMKDQFGNPRCFKSGGDASCLQYMVGGTLTDPVLVDVKDTSSYRLTSSMRYRDVTEPVYNETNEKLAQGLEKLKVVNKIQSQGVPAYKRRRIDYSQHFKPIVLLNYSNKTAAAFEQFLKNQVPGGGGALPTGLINQIPNLKRSQQLQKIEDRMVELANKKLESLSQKYHDGVCALRRQIREDMDQYSSYLKGARVSPTLDFQQYQQNIDVNKGPILRSKTAILRRTLFKEWQEYAKYLSTEYKARLHDYELAVPDYGSKLRDVTPLIGTVNAPMRNACEIGEEARMRLEQERAKLAGEKERQVRAAIYRENAAKKYTAKKRNRNRKNIKSQRQSSAVINMRCKEWFKDVVKIYEGWLTGPNVDDNFKVIIVPPVIGITAKKKIIVPVRMGRDTSRITVYKGDDIASNQYIEKTLSLGVGKLKCTPTETTMVSVDRRNAKATIKELIRAQAVGRSNASTRRKSAALPSMNNINDPLPAPKKPPARKAPVKKIPPPPGAAKSAPKKPPARKVPVKKAAPKKPPSRKAPVKKVSAPVKSPIRRSSRVAKAKRQGKEQEFLQKVNEETKQDSPVVETKEDAPPLTVTLEVTGGGKYSSGRLGSYLVTRPFIVNGPFYLENKEKAAEKKVRIDFRNIYKLEGAGETFALRYAIDKPERRSGADINTIWQNESNDGGKTFKYDRVNNMIELKWVDGKTYKIEHKLDSDKKIFYQKGSGSQGLFMTFLWLEPNENDITTEFPKVDGKRPRLQNRVQIEYDSMSEGDIEEIEKAMAQYDNKLEKSISDYESSSEKASYDSSSDVSMDKVSYDSSSDASVSKVSYNSSSDVSYDKVSYDSQSEDEPIKRRSYDSSSEVSETEMDYSYDSSSGIDESDSNVPYVSDSDS